MSLDTLRTSTSRARPPVTPATPGRASRAARRAARRPGLALSWLVVLQVAGWAVAPSLFAHADPLAGDTGDPFAAPSLSHLFGTDQLGRDMFSRVVHGASETLTATLLAVAVGFVAGCVVGLGSGFLGGRADAAIMRLVDVLLSIPSLLLCMTIVAALGYGTAHVALAVGIASIASFARVMRAEVIKVVRSDYVEAAYGLGAGSSRVLALHVLPNSMASVLSLAALEFGTSVLAVAALGFLGYGAPPPTPEWGLAVSEGRTFLGVYPWLALFPGLVIAVVVLATNRISRSLGARR